MFKKLMLVLVVAGSFIGCSGCDAVSIVADSLDIAGIVVGLFG